MAMGVRAAARTTTAASCRGLARSQIGRRGVAPTRCAPPKYDPSVADDAYVVLGLAHCFEKQDGGGFVDAYVVEPVPSGQYEAMNNGAMTTYEMVHAATLGDAVAQDLALLPPEFAEKGARFAKEFDYRTRAAARTYRREYAQEHLLQLCPLGESRSDFNFDCETHRRVLNAVNVVNDNDNIKQDMSIDVYGRSDEKDGSDDAIAAMYNA